MAPKPHTTRQSRLSGTAVMDWEQLCTNATLLKPTMLALPIIFQSSTRLSGKADLVIYNYSVVVSG